VLFLFIPSIDLIFHVDRTRLGDEATRMADITLAVHDLASLKRLPGNLRWYLQQTFGFRGALVRTHGIVKVHALGVTSSRQVLIGREGWLYLATEGSLDDYRRLVTLSPDKLARYRSVLAERKQWLAAQGIDFVFVIGPSKHTIYPEYMPSSVEQGHGPSALDQLYGAVQDLALDVRPALLAAKPRARLYHATDTHWNELGALVAAGEVARALQKQHALLKQQPALPALPALDLDHVQTTPVTLPGGDLSRLLGLKFDSHEATWHTTFPNGAEPLVDGKPIEVVSVDVQPAPKVRLHNPSAPLRKAVVFRDSFGELLMRPLAQLFREILFVGTDEFNPALIEAEKPDVVIHELVERRIPTHEPHDLAQARALALAVAETDSPSH